MKAMDELVEIMARLRGPSGCPWDREQTPVSLRTYVLEEAYEVAEAIDDGNWGKLRDELGDLLLQVVFLARLAEEDGAFRITDVVDAIAAKLIRRHPHVFEDDKAATPAEVWKRWDEIKDAERRADDAPGGPPSSRLDGIPRSLPALAKARLLVDKASRVGFDWPSAEAVLEKVREETEEVREALARQPAAAAGEVGDLLFAAASLSRRLGVDPETCLESANRKFAGRFRAAELLATASGRRLEDLTPAEIDELWQAAKRA